jgi:hypothetical protein
VCVWRRSRRTVFTIGGLLVTAAVLTGCGGGRVGTLRLPTFTSGCSRRPPISEPAYATVPVKIAQPHPGDALVTVAVCIGSKGPFTFLVNSGLPMSVIDSSLANKLSGPHGFPNSGQCGALDGQQYVTDMMIGPRHIEAGNFAVGNVRSFAGNLSGVIGADLLSRFGEVRIDYQQRTMTVGLDEGPVITTSRTGSTTPTSATKRLRAGTVTAVPMRVHVLNSPSPFSALGLSSVTSTVPVAIGGKSRQFLVDTGTEITSVGAVTAASTPQLSTAGKPYSTAGVLNCHGKATTGQLPSWQIGKTSVGPTKVAVVASRNGYDGVLGSATLRQLSPVVLDYHDGTLLLGRNDN